MDHTAFIDASPTNLSLYHSNPFIGLCSYKPMVKKLGFVG